METLIHNGILVLPQYKARGYQIFLGNEAFQLNDKQEEMAFHWVKKLGTPYVEDPIFRKNFFTDFCKELGIPYSEDFIFEQLIIHVEHEKLSKENMSKEEKKAGTLERKKLREERKAKYGLAVIDRKTVEVSNYIGEPSCIFMGRGQHPSRGRWKEGPREEDITLNLSPNAPRPPGNWKEIIWKPQKMYVASWEDKLSGKTKYVWLSDTWGKKQKRERAKFDKAKELKKNLTKIEHHIGSGLYSSDLQRKKIASVCYLIFNLNLRVGDEKDKDEADTVGAITLRPEHLTINGNRIDFSFLGKDSVRWEKSLEADSQFIKILEYLMCKERATPSLFYGITSKDVTKFLNEVQKGLTAKAFRTYTATEEVKEYLKTQKFHPEEQEFMKVYHGKLGILRASKVCNHKKALPKGFEEKLEKKQLKIDELRSKLREEKNEKKGLKLMHRLSKVIAQEDLYKETSEWNLNTSLKSYVDPREVKAYCDRVGLPYEKLYSKTLLKKFSWCLGE